MALGIESCRIGYELQETAGGAGGSNGVGHGGIGDCYRHSFLTLRMPSGPVT